MDHSLRTRIDAMFGRDKAMAWIFVFLLWLTIAFVYFAVDQFLADGAVRLAIIVGAALLLIFNTASMLAMIRHYAHDKDHIYELDIRHLDESRAARD